MRHIGKTDESTIVQVTISIRRRPGHVPMPKFEDYIGCPPRTRLSVDEFAKKHGACQDDVDAVLRHTFQHGLQYIDHHLARRHLRVKGTIGQLNECFGIDTQDYERDDSYHGTYTYRKHDPIKVPAHVAERIVGVQGISNGMRLRPTLAGDPPNTVALIPSQVSSLYQNIGTSASSQVVGIWGSGVPLTSDIEQTIDQWGVSFPSFTEIAVDGGSSTPGNAEGVLDISMVAAFSNGCAMAIYQPNVSVGTYFADTVGRMIHPNPGDPVCDILTFSFIFTGDIDAASDLQSSDSILEDAASQGVTVFCSTGDEGSSNYSNTGGTAGVFTGYPADSPWVTAVGGTTLGTSSGGISTSNFLEWVWNDFAGGSGGIAATGGGISTGFSVPSYQDGYNLGRSLNTGTAGRGIPDIAGNSSAISGYDLYVNGIVTQTGGTSAASPMYAGMFTNVNAYLGYNVGFLNPTLYACGSGTLQNSPFLTSTTGNFTDSNGVVWTLVGSPNDYQAARNGVTDNTTANIINLIYYTLTRTVYQENLSGNWYSWNGSSWISVPSNTGSRLVAIRDIDGTTGGPQTNAVTFSGKAQTPGYSVGVGWDACTGLGVVNIAPFAFYLKSFTPPSPTPTPPSPPPTPAPTPTPTPSPTPSPTPTPTPSPNSLTLTWSVPSEVITNETVNYIIQYKVASDLAWSNAPIYSNPAPASGMDGVVMSGLQSNTLYAVRINANDSRFCQQVYATTGLGGGVNDSPHGSLMSVIPQASDGTYAVNFLTDLNGNVWEFSAPSAGLPSLSGILTVNGVIDNSLKEINFVLYLNHQLYAVTKDQAWYVRTISTSWTASSDPRMGAPAAGVLPSYTTLNAIDKTIMSYWGGNVLDNCQITVVFWGSAWNTMTNPSASQIVTALNAIIDAGYFSGLQEYGIFSAPGVAEEFIDSTTSASATISNFQPVFTNLIDHLDAGDLAIPTIDNHLFLYVCSDTVDEGGSTYAAINYNNTIIQVSVVLAQAAGINNWTPECVSSILEAILVGASPNGWLGFTSSNLSDAGLTFANGAIGEIQIDSWLSDAGTSAGYSVNGFYSNKARATIIPGTA